jgi:site-specific recombinase XerD
METEPQGWRNPIEKVAAPRVSEEVLEPVSLETVRAMLSTCRRRTFCGDRDFAVLLALLDSGLRASELLALNLGDLDLRSGAIVVRTSKSRKPRIVFIGHRTLREVVRYLRNRPGAQSTEPLWVTRGGAKLRYSGLVSLLRRRAKAVGVPVPLPHAFRRGFALSMLRGGADVVTLQRLLGHADLSVLKRYLKQAEADLAEAHARACPVDRL